MASPIYVAAVENGLRIQHGGDLPEVGGSEFVPLGGDHEGVSAREALVHAFGGFRLRELDAHVLKPFRAECLHPRTGVDRHLHQRDRGRFADVVGLGFEGDAPEGERLPIEIFAEHVCDLLPEPAALFLIHHMDGLVELAGKIDFAPHRADGKRVLGKARTAVAQAGIEELVSDPLVSAHALANVLHVGAVGFAQSRDFVHEGDLAGEHRVRRVLDHLGAADVHHEDGVTLAEERLVELVQRLRGTLALHTTDHAIRLHEVADRIAFLEELRVVRDVKRGVGPTLDEISNLVTGSDRDRALDDDGLGVLMLPKRVDHLGDVAGDPQDVLQIRGSVGVARRSYADEDDIGVLVGGSLVSGELKSAGGGVAVDHLREARLVDRAFAPLEHGDLPFIDVEACDFVPGLCEAGSGH